MCLEELGFALEALWRQNFKQEVIIIKFSLRDQWTEDWRWAGLEEGRRLG